MNKRDFILTAAVVVILVLGFVIYGQNFSSRQQFAGNSKPPETAGAADSKANGFFIGSLYATIVTYTDNGFSPSAVTIPKGGAVIFRNYSSKSMRVASNPHPSHGGYPSPNGCVGSTFDSCSGVPPKVSWSFTFDSAGTWDYHDHLNPGRGGTVIVQ